MFGESPLPFTVVEGTPSVCFVRSESEKLLPWHAFNEGERNGDEIELKFQGCAIHLKGDGLELLWEAIRRQDVATIRLSTAADENSQCRITEIVVRLAVEEA